MNRSLSSLNIRQVLHGDSSNWQTSYIIDSTADRYFGEAQVERESADSEDRVHIQAEIIEDRSPAQVAVDDAPDEALEVPATQTPRFTRRQSNDRGR